MRLRKIISFDVMCDGVTNTFTASITDICSNADTADISPVDAIEQAILNVSTGGQVTGVATLNSKGTVVTVTFSSAPPVGDGNLNIGFLRNA